MPLRMTAWMALRPRFRRRSPSRRRASFAAGRARLALRQLSIAASVCPIAAWRSATRSHTRAGPVVDPATEVYSLIARAGSCCRAASSALASTARSSSGVASFHRWMSVCASSSRPIFSSVAVWKATNENCLNEASPCQPKAPYGQSKLEAERLVLEGGYVPEPVVLRLTMVYGPGMKGNLPRMIEAVARGLFPPIPEFGNKRSRVHVDDVVQAALLAAEKPEAIGQTYIVTHPQPCSTRKLYEWICEALGRPIPGWQIPEIVLGGLAKFGDAIGQLRGRRFIFDSDALEKLAGSAWYSPQKIENELGFQAQHPLRESLRDII